jgi:L-lactate dehydrogenase complex protein LldE
MKVALFIPCYIDAFFPEVGIATLELLERLGCEVDYPLDQTCCGQPMANSGCHDDARGTEALFAQNFAGYDHIVTPSGSCAHHVRDQMTAIEQTPAVQAVRRNTRELVEFLHDVLGVREFPWAEFPHKVGLHIGCATLRGLREAKASEIDEPAFNKPQRLLSAVKGNRVRAARSGRTNAAASAAPSRSSRSRCRRRWATTRSRTTIRRAPSTSSRPTCRASCTSRAARAAPACR